jgi:CRISPR/Cas system-associated exonuclease Cas4 (RecB family)
VYEKFRNGLRAAGKGYDGMIYREVAEMCEQGNIGEIPYKKIIFVGFNAMNQCERIFFRWLNNAKHAGFYWDSDPYYLDNTMHEAGRFLRENISEFGGWKRTETGMTPDKHIQFVNVSSNISQAKLTGQLLESFSAGSPEEEMNIAVVLPDENLLVPVLSAIPAKYKQVNVTMGLTLKDSPVYEMINQLVQLQSAARLKSNKLVFYYKQVLDLLDNPVLSGASGLAEGLKNEIRKKNMVVVDAAFLAGDEFLKTVFYKTEGSVDLCSWLIRVLEMAAQRTGKGEEASAEANLQSEFLYHAFLALQRLHDLLTEKQADIKTETFSRLLKKVLADVEVAFRGEPLAGIQVMGVLETRLLDFDRLIILSMNEGIFPKKSAGISFIPQSLRRGFHLPAIGHQDAIYSYYFFRLIQRAKQVILAYNTQSGGMKSGEPSRFIYQLKYSGKFNISYSNLDVNASSGKVQPIVVEKNPEIMEILKSYLSETGSDEGRYLSPSAINTWLQCKLKFYFRVVAGLREPDELSEEVDARMLGNLFHTAAELLYKQSEGRQMQSGDFKNLGADENLRETVRKAFDEAYFQKGNAGAQELTGRNLIVADILFSYLKQVVRIDTGLDGLKILALEKKVTGVMECKSESESETNKLKVRIGGVIDRLDETGGVLRIIDYKTGGDKTTVKDVEALFEQGNQHGALLQLLIYAWLLRQESNTTKAIVPGLYKVQSLFAEEFEYRITIDKEPYTGSADVIESVKEGLGKVLSEIFHPQVHFEQVNDEKICQYCAYKGICFPGRGMMSESGIE